MSTSFISVGDLMLDVTVQRGAAPHEARVSAAPGGVAANAAVWAAAAGAQATAVGRVGGDAAGSLIRTALEARGVRARLAVEPSLPTGTLVDDGGELAVDRGANVALAAGDLGDLDAGVLLVSGYALGYSEGARAALVGASAPWTVVVGAVDERARLVVVNEREAAGRTPAELAAGRAAACVTRGAGGAALAVGGETYEQEPGEAVAGPARGAGDALAATLAVALAGGADPASALAAAVEAAARAAAGGWPD